MHTRRHEEETEPPPERRIRFPLPPHPIAAEQARIITRITLTDWTIADIIDSALIITTELVANALKLGDVFHLSLSQQGGGVLIEVRDSSEAPPDRRRPSSERVDGRGLLLVEACAKDWGWRLEDQGGKTIWAVIDAAPEGHGDAQRR
ncbi:ATP-binding protein [Actinomadura sp. DC4]|uniref:ATP-binding protein n=1 Tax=Actinomadura sp. DC4 TaxID=3055069 RepID=UPI0025B26A57|nr:ATP-binding protein [Actinomadura sp. DC4]MDN3351572.1 ATP-binding protein [Actinomadura sp. DC4]